MKNSSCDFYEKNKITKIILKLREIKQKKNTI